MSHLFETFDKTGRKIRLTQKQWSHIRQDHPDIENSSDIEETIKNPAKMHYLEENKVAFYKYFKHKKDSAKYLKVIAKYLNGEGFIITAHFLRAIK